MRLAFGLAMAMGVVAMAAIAATACSSSPRAGDATDAGTSPSPSFGGEAAAFPEDASPAIQARYVLTSCAGGPESSCHGSGAGDLVLPDGTPSRLVNVASSEEPGLLRVRPGDPGRSYLFMKLTGAPGIDGGQMPLGQAPLDARSLDAVARWIEAGAEPP